MISETRTAEARMATATDAEIATGFTSGVQGSMNYDRGLLRIDWPCGPRWYPVWHLREQFENATPERKAESAKRLEFLVGQVLRGMKNSVRPIEVDK